MIIMDVENYREKKLGGSNIRLIGKKIWIPAFPLGISSTDIFLAEREQLHAGLS